MNLLTQELHVAFSKRAQSRWLRITKGLFLVGVAFLLHSTPYFWGRVGGLPAPSCASSIGGKGQPRLGSRAAGMTSKQVNANPHFEGLSQLHRPSGMLAPARNLPAVPHPRRPIQRSYPFSTECELTRTPVVRRYRPN